MVDKRGTVKDMRATDIVGYTYQAETLCPTCVVHAITGDDSHSDAEWVLNIRAEQLGIDRMDERSFDSGDFPKVVFAGQIEPCGECGYCQDGEAVAVGCANELCNHCGEELL